MATLESQAEIGVWVQAPARAFAGARRYHLRKHFAIAI